VANIPAAIAVVVGHCTAAGAALANPITDVANADPIPHSGRSIRVWWSGEADPIKRGAPRTINAELVGELVTITMLWSVSDAGETMAAARDAEVFALKSDLRTRLHGDVQLGGNVTDLELSYAVSDHLVYDGGLYRHVELVLTLDFSEYPILP
jgi:hypothetical protein